MSDVTTLIGNLLANNITGPIGSKVFIDRVKNSFPDSDFVENNVKKNEPYLSVIFASQIYKPAYRFVEKNTIRTISDIVHIGDSLASFTRTGQYRGNANFVLRIENGGPFNISQYSISKDGGETWGEALDVPDTGVIEIGDGTTVAFGAESDLIVGDTYSWQTVSVMNQKYQTDELTATVAINIYAATQAELLGEGDFIGYINQVQEFFTQQRAIHDGLHIYKVSLDRSTQPSLDIRGNKFRGVLSIFIEGALYRTVRVPLIGELAEEISEN